MSTIVNRIAPFIATAALAGSIGLASIAVADSGAALGLQNQTVAYAAPAAPTPAPVESGASPLVPLGPDPDAQEPFDPYLKNPAGGTDLPS